MVWRRLTQDLDRRLEDLYRAQDTLSTGKRVRKPSDDPVGVANVVALRSGLKATERYEVNVGQGLTWVNVTDTVLSQVSDIMSRARELAIYGASDTLPQASRDALAEEVDQLLQQAVQLGNKDMDGRYIFSGHRTHTPPFAIVVGPPKQVVYNGDSGEQLREIGPGFTLGVNVVGDGALLPAFSALVDLSSRLRSGDTAALGTTTLSAIDAASDNILAVRAELGAKGTRLELARERLDEVKHQIKVRLSGLEDADMAEAVIDLNTAEATYRAALVAATRAVQPTLLDFLAGS